MPLVLPPRKELQIRDFEEDLNWSHGQADDPCWEQCYRVFFPDLIEIRDRRHDDMTPAVIPRGRWPVRDAADNRFQRRHWQRTKLGDRVLSREETPELILADVHPPGADPHVIIGPLVTLTGRHHPSTPPIYFVSASADESGFVAVTVGAADRQDAEELRTAIMVALARKGALVIHDFADELEMARRCEAIWPGEETRGIRAAIEAERSRRPQRCPLSG
jgi:hypothetical protein